jgi:hypothetical protein
MKPKFKDINAWEQAQILMQPAFIRLVDNLGKQLEGSDWQGTYREVQLPYPGYQLLLTRGELAAVVDIWDLCFQICFLSYYASGEGGYNGSQEVAQEVEVDTSLLDETGEVDWQQLETKTQALVRQIFANLPES